MHGAQIPWTPHTIPSRTTQTTTTDPPKTTPEMLTPLARKSHRQKEERVRLPKTPPMTRTSAPVEVNRGQLRPTDASRRLTPPAHLKSGGCVLPPLLQISFHTHARRTHASLPPPLTYTEVHGVTRQDGKATTDDTTTGDSLQSADSLRPTRWPCSTPETNISTQPSPEPAVVGLSSSASAVQHVSSIGCSA